MSKPSRHDTSQLISGYAGAFFNSNLYPFDRSNCDVRDLSSNHVPFLPNTKVVILLGEEALNAYKPNTSLNEQRGSPFTVNGTVFIASYAPQDAFDRRDYESEEDESEAETSTEKDHQKTKRRNWRYWLHADQRKAVRILQEGLLRHEAISSYIYPASEDVVKALNLCKNGRLFLDIETNRKLNLSCFGFLYEPDEGGFTESQKIYVVPFERYTGELAYDKVSCCKILAALAGAMARCRVICHNSMFDVFVLAYKYRLPFPLDIYDTMLAWHRCYPEIEKSLGHLISFFTDLPYHKDEGVFDPQNSSQETKLWNYNAKDIFTLKLVYDALQKQVVKSKAQASVKQVMRSIRPYLTMMFFGARIDTEKYLQRFKDHEDKRVQIGRILNFIVGGELNPRSPKQVAEYLYLKLGLEVPAKDPTNEKQLLKHLTRQEVPSIKCIIAYRGEGKAASALKFRLWNQGKGEIYDRLTTAYALAGTDTFRRGSRALLRFKPDKGYGTNAQNWNKKQRDLIIADYGKKLGQNDQAGAEALIVAYLCRAGKFRDLFNFGVKPHTFVAMHMFKDVWVKEMGGSIDKFLSASIKDLPALDGWKKLKDTIAASDNWSGDKRYYYIAKQTCHSANYGIKAPTFQMNVLLKSEGSVALTIKQCNNFLGMYHDLFPEIREWHCDIQHQLENGRVLYNLFGFPRRFHEPTGHELYKQGYAFIPQSTVGCITAIAITELQEKIENNDYILSNGFDLLGDGHDSVLWQADNDKCLDCGKEVKKHLERELVNSRGEKFKMGSELAIGLNWGPKSQYNPNGLEEVKL